MKSRVTIICIGIVQGIGFRPFVYRTAKKLNLTGFVQNRGDAGVQIIIEGVKTKILNFIDLLKNNKPSLAKYEDFQIQWSNFKDEFSDFTILKSSDEKVGGISYLPSDISICDECLRDMENSNDSRYKYAFTSCAICGPRYTTIKKLPYDRFNTSMNDFPLCNSCKREYLNPIDRRYHAQTTCCINCGPKLVLYNKGEKMDSIKVVEEIGKLITEGNIVAIKGIGGTHLACSSVDDEPILHLRFLKGKRKYKPFATISKSIEDIKKYALVNPIEEVIIKSHRKPIVLLQKKNPFILSKWISPNLSNIGVMLPYSGIHSLILNEIKEPSIILTSANPSDVPMYIENKQILTNIKSLTDYVLLHDRQILQRADDSVIRLINNHPVIIRRSRGWVPEPINLPFDLKDNISLGVGPLLASTGAIALRNRCFPTQHIGDVETIETLDFLESAIKHLSSLLKVKSFSSIGCDLHPNFLSSTLAESWSKEYKINLYKIQHHYAHAIALMIDNEIPLNEEIITIVADGIGYGPDGKIWGGEILHCTYNDYRRIGHLEEQSMIGGDRATYFPMRMVIGILSKILSANEIQELLEKHYSGSLAGGKNEIQVLLVQLDKKINIFKTSSTGRILAASSALLKSCYERTYEGEPEMVLESIANHGKKGEQIFHLPILKTNEINTTELIYQALQKFISGKNPADLALAIHLEIANQFADIAIDYAKNNSINKIGFTGGVAYNNHITTQIAKRVKKANLKFYQHINLPCGDGGISSGQAIIAALKNM